MRHNRDWRKLNRTASHRRAMLRNMVTSLFAAERIRTTTAKAKEARRVAERMITFARRGDLSARRHVAKIVNDPAVLQKLFADIAPRYVDRPGGYTRILKIGIRRGDAAQRVILELVGADEEKRKKKKKARKKRQKVEVPEKPQVAKGKAKKEEAGEVAPEEGAEEAAAEEAVTDKAAEEAPEMKTDEAAETEAQAGEKPAGKETPEKSPSGGKGEPSGDGEDAEAGDEEKRDAGAKKEPGKGGKK